MSRTTHGHAQYRNMSPTYLTWLGMHDRCRNKNHPSYKNYGGRGITVCFQWRFFENFLADMGEKPTELSIDRIDNNSGYSPENCRWTDATTQVLNRRIPRTNTSGVKGVCFNKQKNKWVAQAGVAYKRVGLYYGDSFEEACAARKAWEEKNSLLGELTND